MSDLNEVSLIGRLGKDPEIRQAASGNKFATFRMATGERWTDKATGEKKERTEWHSVVIFNEALAGIVEKYLKKGARVFVRGRLATRKWQDQTGQDRYSTEIVLQGFDAKLQMLDAAKSGYQPGGDGETSHAETKPAGAAATGATAGDDEIPF